MPTDAQTHEGRRRPVVLVTGPSGAGRSTAIAALEDLGFEAIDNPPLSLLPRLLEPGGEARPLALGLDSRGRDFTPDALSRTIEALGARPDLSAETLYLDCRADVILRRYSETRRRHPLAPEGDPAAGVAREAAMLGGLRERASVLVDTSDMTPHDLRAQMERLFAPGDGPAGLSVTVTSFSYKRGIPPGTDTAFDCRFLANPHWDPALRDRDGRDADVARAVAADPRHDTFLGSVLALLRLVVPAHEAEGRSHLGVGLGCTGGQHRSVSLAESLGRALAEDGTRVSIRHRELERRAPRPAARVQATTPRDGAAGPDATPGGHDGRGAEAPGARVDSGRGTA